MACIQDFKLGVCGGGRGGRGGPLGLRLKFLHMLGVVKC